MTLTNQAIIFFAFIIAGCVGGIFFDFFRAFRKNIKTIDFVVYVEDFIFWLLLGFIALFTAYLVSDGQIRIYMLFSMLFGGILYFLIFSNYFYKVFSLFFRYILSIVLTIFNAFRRTNHEAKTQNT